MPHLAGTDGDKITADYVLKEWLQQGLDVVTPTSYNVLLDYPDEVRFNSIEIRNSDQTLAQTYEIKEEVLDADNDYSKITKPFLAYSINGSFSFVSLHLITTTTKNSNQISKFSSLRSTMLTTAVTRTLSCS